MFGYIKCYKPELKIIEYDSYKAIYCGLCKRLRSLYGLPASFTLSYDFAFLSLLHASIGDGVSIFDTTVRCAVNPLKKINCCTDGAALDYSCDIAMIMLYHKLKDNMLDGKFLERMKTAGAVPYANIVYKKAKNKHPELSKFVEQNMILQRKTELNNTTSFDKASDPSAKSLAYIFEKLSEQESQKRVLYRLGYFLGRWVYLMDAIDDLESDEKNGCYNVLVSRNFGKNTFDDAVKNILPSLNSTLNEIVNAYELLNIKRFGPILDNILYMGLKNVQDTILYKNMS